MATKTPIQSAQAPKAVGPYSQGIISGDFVFLSGQIPVNPEAGAITAKTVDEQTEQVIHNISALLKEAGCTLDDVVKSSVFLVDLGQFASMNQVYSKYFTSNQPARSTIQVAALPLGAQVEIEVIARRK